MLEKIFDLINSELLINIDLALELAKSNGFLKSVTEEIESQYKFLNRYILDDDKLNCHTLKDKIGFIQASHSLHIEEDITPHLSKLAKLHKLNSIFYKPSHSTPFPDIFLDFKNLESLWISNCQLNKIPEKIRTLKKLKTLSIRNTPIDNISIITGLKAIEFLYLENNKIKSIPSTISNMPNLKVLDIGKNQISDVPKEFIYLDKLYMLELDHNNLSFLPAVLYEMENLSHINLIGNNIPIKEVHVLRKKYPKHRVVINNKNYVKLPF